MVFRQLILFFEPEVVETSTRFLARSRFYIGTILTLLFLNQYLSTTTGGKVNQFEVVHTSETGRKFFFLIRSKVDRTEKNESKRILVCFLIFCTYCY